MPQNFTTTGTTENFNNHLSNNHLISTASFEVVETSPNQLSISIPYALNLAINHERNVLLRIENNEYEIDVIIHRYYTGDFLVITNAPVLFGYSNGDGFYTILEDSFIDIAINSRSHVMDLLGADFNNPEIINLLNEDGLPDINFLENLEQSLNNRADNYSNNSTDISFMFEDPIITGLSNNDPYSPCSM